MGSSQWLWLPPQHPPPPLAASSGWVGGGVDPDLEGAWLFLLAILSTTLPLSPDHSFPAGKRSWRHPQPPASLAKGIPRTSEGTSGPRRRQEPEAPKRTQIAPVQPPRGRGGRPGSTQHSAQRALKIDRGRWLDAHRAPKALTAAAWSHLAENQDYSESPRGSKRPVKCLEEAGKVTSGPGQGGGCRPACQPSSVCLPLSCQHPQPSHKAPPHLHPLPCPGLRELSAEGPHPAGFPKLGGQGKGPQVMFAFLFHLLDSSGLWGCGSDLRSKFSSWVLSLLRQVGPGKLSHLCHWPGTPGGRWAPEVSADRVRQGWGPRRRELGRCPLNSRCSPSWGTVQGTVKTVLEDQGSGATQA